jgi:hypothetical protein
MLLKLRRLRRISSAMLVVIALALGAAGSAHAESVLAGDWAPFSRCPVDNVLMLEATGESSVALCVAFDAPSGSLTVGRFTLPFGEANTQFGIVEENEVFATISPASGVIAAAPVKVPGGLSAFCSGARGLLGSFCATLAEHAQLNDLYAQLESVDEPSDLSLGGAFSTERSAIALPVQIRLINPLLGPQCAIGSPKQPIVLQPVNASSPELSIEGFEANGTPTEGEPTMVRIVLHGANQVDRTFAVPSAHDCGPLAQLDQMIDTALGLPSPSGANSLVLGDVTVDLTGLDSPGDVVPDDGRILAQYWHSVVQR